MMKYYRMIIKKTSDIQLLSDFYIKRLGYVIILIKSESNIKFLQQRYIIE